MEGIEMTMNVNTAVPVSVGIETGLSAQVGSSSLGMQSLESQVFEQSINDEIALSDVRQELEGFKGDNSLEEALDFEEAGFDSGNEEEFVDVQNDKNIEESDAKSAEEAIIGKKDELDIKKEIAGVSDKLSSLREEIAVLGENELTPEAILKAILLLESLRGSENSEERKGILELMIDFVGRFMLEILPGGEEVLDKKSKIPTSKKPPINIDDIRDLLGMRKKIRSLPIENKAA